MVPFCSGSPSRPRHEGNSHFLLLGLRHSCAKMWRLELLQLSSVYEQKSLRTKADRLRTSVGEKEFGSLMIALNSYISQTCLSHLPVCHQVGFWPVHIPTDRATGGDRDVTIYGWVWEQKTIEPIYIYRSIGQELPGKQFSPLENSSTFNSYLSWNKSLILCPTFP